MPLGSAARLIALHMPVALIEGEGPLLSGVRLELVFPVFQSFIQVQMSASVYSDLRSFVWSGSWYNVPGPSVPWANDP